LLRKFIGERISVWSCGAARKAIFMVQPAENRRRDHLGVFGEATHARTRNGHPMASNGFPVVLAVEVKASWATAIAGRPAAADR
jgi:hypothetical protein